jgi:ribosome recycling factor
MLDDIFKQARQNMDKAVGQFQLEVNKIRTSRANSAMVEDVMVEHYGTKMPLKQIASVTTPQANLIQIIPWDKTALGSIESALSKVDLGASPNNDGNMIRISLPPVTGERRERLIDLLKKQSEEVRIVLRQIREEAWKEIQDREKRGELTKDDRYRGKDELDRLIGEFNQKIEEIVKIKEREIILPPLSS